jgi:hypothetical protein
MNPIEKKKKTTFWLNKQKKLCEAMKARKLTLKNLFDKIHKLIVKELKLNINDHIKRDRTHNLFQV